ncbi:short-chain dehydrogenase/reductase SDR [Fimicolochytrium jonesii]|uniref:short-chain dehydrogenase/reductase SDR n=1 Tax=Fimicolochytrium jonesii TaxID=1396493 RepID=UPI0022FE2B00|nr:short-chain dehydrogenase/reductase SDR [Fimicolochytrium jonesii]KAI8816553.1 short-chain dehydrogenase/reductase SDR [Fimicolochytrium jonesii]
MSPNPNPNPKGNSIMLTGSSAGTTGAAFSVYIYNASKAAIRNVARTWAEDLKGTGIKANVLSPGPTAMDLAKEALGEDGIKAFARMADPAEIGAVAAFLASDDSTFMTASEIAFDGDLAQI